MKTQLKRTLAAWVSLCGMAFAGGGELLSSSSSADSPFLPELKELTQEEGKSSLQETMRMFDSVIESAQNDQLVAVDRNIEYNEQRQIVLARKLEAKHRILNRLDEQASIQFDKVADHVGGDVSGELLGAAAQLRRQYQATRSSLEDEIRSLHVELATVKARLADKSLQREIIGARRQLNQPFQLIEDISQKKNETSKDGQEAVDFFQKLSNSRISKRAASITSFNPRSVDGLIVQYLIRGGK